MSTKRISSLLFIMASLIVIATGDDNCKDISTFNTGLVNNLGMQEIRLPKIVEAIMESSHDFICLQEVWFEKDLIPLLKGVEDEYPFHYSAIHRDIGVLRRPPCNGRERPFKDTPCTRQETRRLAPQIGRCGTLGGCFNESYSNLQRGVCIILSCKDVLRSGIASEECISCINLNFPNPVDQSMERCSTPGDEHNRLNSPGLVILSKTPVSDVSYTKYFPDNKLSVQRGYIQAKLDDGKLAVCTHLSSIFPFYLEYDLSFNNYAEQNIAEIGKLNDAFSDKTHILVGDVNSGPIVTGRANPEQNLGGEFPDNYEYLKSFGYRSPYLQQDGRCTFCSSNILTGGYTNNVIDQVMVKPGTFATNNAMRVFDTGIPPMSDHYGVKVQVCDQPLP